MKYTKKITLRLFLTALVATLMAPLALPMPRAAALQQLIFPVLGPSHYVDDYYAPRPNNAIHGATDIIASKGQPIVAVTDGTISLVNYPEPSWGWSVSIKDAAGYRYNYLHINNDTPGTNDNNGGPMRAYAPDMKVGNRVVAGQLLGWVGDSGNANGVSHLHFELETPDGQRVDPYGHLNGAARIANAVTPPALQNETLPYGINFTGGVNIAMGNFDADPESEVVSGAGAGGSPHVRLFDADNTPIGGGIMAYDPSFHGGVDVATGDVDGDGIDEIITGAGPGASPHVRILKVDGSEIGGFYAYSPSFPGGVRVAAGDVDGDGKAEIITAPASNGGPHVRVLKPDGTEVQGFYAYDPSFQGGVDVASADVSGGSTAEVITSPGPGGGPHVRVFNGQTGTAITGFAAYGDFTGGVKVSAGDVQTSSSKAEILTVPWANGGPHIRMFNGGGASLSQRMFLEQWWQGFYDIAAAHDGSRAATGTNRRASIRAAF